MVKSYSLNTTDDSSKIKFAVKIDGLILLLGRLDNLSSLDVRSLTFTSGNLLLNFSRVSIYELK